MEKRRAGAYLALILFAFFVPHTHRLTGEFVSAASVETVTTSSSVTLTSALSIIGAPVHLMIPSINIDSPIDAMGLNKKGELDVPSGHTSHVGWYKDGTVPGTTGSAVLDAHVFAAFKNLKDARAGTDIYIVTDNGQTLHFRVEATHTFALSDLTSDILFGSDGHERLNLITCAGALTRDKSTYDHRLVVFATFVGIETT